MQKNPTVLLILDGFGHSNDEEYNAIAKAKTPNWDSLNKEYPNTLINASESYVGLPSGQMGNSEVGHLNIGAGRVIHQDIERINLSIKSKELYSNPILNENFQSTKNNNKTLHIFGLVSDGGVHSHIDHFNAIILLAKQNNLKKVFIHAFLDGRDTPPKSAEKYISIIEKFCKKNDTGELVSLCGRFFAMDRDNRWERTKDAFNLLVHGDSKYYAESAQIAIEDAYKRNETDEFITPTLIKTKYKFEGINDNDTIIFMNFRSDRARQLSRLLVNDFSLGFIPEQKTPDIDLFTLSSYAEDLNATVIFPQSIPKNTLGEVLEQNNIKQLRIAETEKYAHVSLFFNGGIEKNFYQEERILIPSP